MKKRKIILILFIFTAFPGIMYGQDFFMSLIKGWSVSASVNYISSATICNNPYSTDPLERNVNDELGSGFGYGLSLRKKILGDNISLVVSTEYIKINDENLFEYLENESGVIKVRASEKIWMMPLEISLVFRAFNISDYLSLYLGGGVGIYYGDRTKKIANFNSETLSKNTMFNIHILSGLEYFLSNKIAGIFEVKFREAGIKNNSLFPADNFFYNGKQYFFDKYLNSKIFFDGVKLSLGLCYYLK